MHNMNYFLACIFIGCAWIYCTPWFAAFAQANTIHLYICLCIRWTNCCDTWIPKYRNHVAFIFQEASHRNCSCGVLITASKCACNNHTCMSKNCVASIVCRKVSFLTIFFVVYSHQHNARVYLVVARSVRFSVLSASIVFHFAPHSSFYSALDLWLCMIHHTSVFYFQNSVSDRKSVV